jgi:hypothetical protein
MGRHATPRINYDFDLVQFTFDFESWFSLPKQAVAGSSPVARSSTRHFRHGPSPTS